VGGNALGTELRLTKLATSMTKGASAPFSFEASYLSSRAAARVWSGAIKRVV